MSSNFPKFILLHTFSFHRADHVTPHGVSFLGLTVAALCYFNSHLFTSYLLRWAMISWMLSYAFQCPNV